MRVVIATKSGRIAACEWLAAAKIRRCGFDDGNTTVAALKRCVRQSRQRCGDAVPPDRRAGRHAALDQGRRRDRQACAHAAALGCRLFEGILGIIEPGMTEAAVAAELEHRARLAGAEAMSFPTIVASGERSALPHGSASLREAAQPRLRHAGFRRRARWLLLRHDPHRAPGAARPRKSARVYDAVLEAQEAGVAAVRAGATRGDVDEAARSVLRTHKLDKWFTHSTGHGVGLEIHEGPRLAAKQNAEAGSRNGSYN